MKTRYKSGDYNIISDQSGQKYKRSECRLGVPGSIQAGLLVHKDEWSPRHPQLDIRPRPEHIAVKQGRPRQETQWADGQGPNDSKEIFVDERGALPGAVDSFFSTPNSATSSVVSNFTLFADIQIGSFDDLVVGRSSIINKWAGSQSPLVDLRSYALRVVHTDIDGIDRLFFDYSDDGGQDGLDNESIAIPFGIFQRFSLAVHFNGPALETTFYTALEGEELTQLGAVQTALTSTLFNTSEPTRIGVRNVVNEPNPFNGEIFRAQVRSGGITGPILLDFNPEEYDFDTEPSTLISSSGETWTLNGNATIQRTQVV